MQFNLENGTELWLCPVSQVTLEQIIADLGGYALQSRLAALPEAEVRAHFAAYTPEELAAYLAAQQRQLYYCLGWGVVNDPDPAAGAALALLEKSSPHPHIQRLNWLLYVAGLTRQDKARLIGAIMALTYADAVKRDRDGD